MKLRITMLSVYYNLFSVCTGFYLLFFSERNTDAMEK